MENIKVKINLEDGRHMNAELYQDVAPISVNNFVELVKSNFYNGVIFHRVISGFMVQCGGFEKTMKEKVAPKTIKGEFSANGVENNLKHIAGVLSMARTNVKDSASSQFFICVDTCTHLDGNYAGFGKLCDEDSIKVCQNIATVQTQTSFPHSDVPVKPIIIKNIEII